MPAELAATRLRTPPTKTAGVEDRLRRFLGTYWLRPENALWMTLRSGALARTTWGGPALDACCGDGVFSFLHMGGSFDPSFDVYRGVESKATGRTGGDLYDFVSDQYRPQIVVQPSRTIDVGSDMKKALLTKADRLHFYGRTVTHDHNLPLPFAAESFQTVYCNAVYWMHNVPGLLAEFRRIVRPGGCVILHVKLDTMRRQTLEPFRAAIGDQVLSILGGDRLDCWPGLTDRAGWESRFRSAGLRLVDAQPFVTATHALMWYVGLRPIAPLLMRMAAGLNEDTRLSIKRDWIDLVAGLLEPLCRGDFSLHGEKSEPAEVQYVLASA